MSNFGNLSSARRALFAVLTCLTLQSPAWAFEASSLEPGSTSNFSSEYTRLTKKILLTGIDLERFSLNYRLQNCREPGLLKFIFFGTQEAGAACGLAFEATAVDQFNRGRNHLLDLNKRTLGHGLRAAEIGSIIAASGSSFELAANAYRYIRRHQNGFDTKSANRYVLEKLHQYDSLMTERDALVSANSQHPAYNRAIIEGKILHCLRGAFATEYNTFSVNSRSAFTVQNMFFFLNASYNVLGAIGAHVGYLSLDKPKLNGTSNVVFTVSGALAGAAPLLCSAELWAERKILNKIQKQKFGVTDDLAELAKQRALLENSQNDSGSLIPSLPGSQRLALYSEANQLFVKQLENETTTMQRLNKVALQNSFMGPAIGSLLMTQGILGTRGYYRYFPNRPRKQLNLDYKGAICGTVGTSMAVVGNAAWAIASLSYEHHLAKEKRLPEQLIKSRLDHLAEVEKSVNAL